MSNHLALSSHAVKMRSCTILKREEKMERAYDFLREKGWHEKGLLCEKRKEKKRKEERKGAGSFVSTLGFLPRIQEVRREGELRVS